MLLEASIVICTASSPRSARVAAVRPATHSQAQSRSKRGNMLRRLACLMVPSMHPGAAAAVAGGAARMASSLAASAPAPQLSAQLSDPQLLRTLSYINGEFVDSAEALEVSEGLGPGRGVGGTERRNSERLPLHRPCCKIVLAFAFPAGPSRWSTPPRVRPSQAFHAPAAQRPAPPLPPPPQRLSRGRDGLPRSAPPS